MIENQEIVSVLTSKKRRHSDTALQTPSKRQEVLKFRNLLVDHKNSTVRDRRHGFAKMVKALDKNSFWTADLQRDLTAAKAKIIEKASKKSKKRVVADPNKTFATYQNMATEQKESKKAEVEKTAKAERTRLRNLAHDEYKKQHPADWLRTQAENLATQMANKEFESWCFSWHISQKEVDVGTCGAVREVAH